MLAQIVAAYFILTLIGTILTYHVNSGYYLSDLVKRLYQVKATSVGALK